MCIIIERPVNNRLSVATLKSAIQTNKEGWGFMYPEDGRIVVKRGMKPEEFYTAYDEAPQDRPMVLHFRIKTSGLVNLENTHPFQVLTKDEDGIDLSVVHNGYIPATQYDEIDKDMNDTWHWAQQIARPVLRGRHDLLAIPQFIKMMESTIGGSRVLFMDGLGTITLLGSTWTEHEGCRLSNTIGISGVTRVTTYVGGSYGYNYNAGTNTGSKKGSRRVHTTNTPGFTAATTNPNYVGAGGSRGHFLSDSWSDPENGTDTGSTRISPATTLLGGTATISAVPDQQPRITFTGDQSPNTTQTQGTPKMNGHGSLSIVGSAGGTSVTPTENNTSAETKDEDDTFMVHGVKKSIKLITLHDLQGVNPDDFTRMIVNYPDHVEWLLIRAREYSFHKETPKPQTGKFIARRDAA